MFRSRLSQQARGTFASSPPRPRGWPLLRLLGASQGSTRTRRGLLGPPEGKPMARLRERGIVTAELALGLPAVVLVVVLMLGGLGASLTQLRCQDAARAAARAISAGESAATATSIAHQVAGAEATITITHSDGWISVNVRRAGPGPLQSLTLQAQAQVPREPG